MITLLKVSKKSEFEKKEVKTVAETKLKVTGRVQIIKLDLVQEISTLSKDEPAHMAFALVIQMRPVPVFEVLELKIARAPVLIGQHRFEQIIYALNGIHPYPFYMIELKYVVFSGH